MPQQNPRLVQWQQRHAQAMAAVKAAEARRDQQAIRAAYENLRNINMAKPDGMATAQGQGSKPAKPAAPKRSGGLSGILSTVNNALRGDQR